MQVETLKEEGFNFLSAAPAIDKGMVVIHEIRHEGAVNTLLASSISDSKVLFG